MTLQAKEEGSLFKDFFQFSQISSNVSNELQKSTSISDLGSLKDSCCTTSEQISSIVNQIQSISAMDMEQKRNFINALNKIKDETLEEIISWVDIQRQILMDEQHLRSSLNLPSDPKLTNAFQQRVLFQMANKEYESSATKSNIFYILSSEWYSKWCAFTKHLLTEEIIQSCELSIDDILRTSVSPRPPPISNHVLQDTRDLMGLKADLTENEYCAVHPKLWKLLLSWYGGGPIFKRSKYKEYEVSLYPCLISTVECDDETGIPDETTSKLREYPQYFTLAEVVSALTEEFFGTFDQNTPSVHLWLPFESIRRIFPFKMENFTVTMEEVLAAENDDHHRYVEVPDDSLQMKLSELDFSEHIYYKSDSQQLSIVHGYIHETSVMGMPLVVIKLILGYYEIANSPFLWIEKKRKSDGIWPRAKTDENWNEFKIGDILDVMDNHQTWYQGVVRRVDKDKNGLCIHFIGWGNEWDEWVSSDPQSGKIAKRRMHTTGPHRVLRSD